MSFPPDMENLSDMKRIAVLMLLVASAFGLGQDMMGQIPTDELKAIDFLTGSFKADLSFNFGPETSKGTGTIKSEMSLNGRFNRASHVYSMAEGAPPMEGMQMLTYDPGRKKYVSHWFDGTNPVAIAMLGDLKGDTLTLTGVMDAEGQKMNMRATYKKVSGGFAFLLEIQQGTAWMKLIEGNYKKV